MLGWPAALGEPVVSAAFTGTFLGRHSPARASKGRTEPVLSQGPKWSENLGRAAWVMKSSCPSPALGQRWQLQRGVTSSIPPIWQGDTKPLPPQTPILSIQERFFLPPGISNQPMCAGNRASHRLAKEK